VNKLGIDNINNRIDNLKKYADQKLAGIKNLIYYNSGIMAPTLIFNIKGINSQDLASYLGTKHVVVRSGLSCAKLVKESSGVNSYVRASLGVYNDFSDIDKLVKALKSFKKGDELAHVI
ncbi:MAG: aminotransferase class V-fold PLP-dependent enzyme, partial [Mycoplasmoidaceae bacterium]|nr:aminotransferase class V-fold PLP-dependent enzyme [Mycoplasmoidaceae bacterium]